MGTFRVWLGVSVRAAGDAAAVVAGAAVPAEEIALTI
jgi:hypothetical protein